MYWSGQAYRLPDDVIEALEATFQSPVRGVRVVEYSLYARAHRGMTATTRPNLILVAGGGHRLVSDPELLLHEYFHVLRQWNTGHLTRWRYLHETMRRGYWNNRFESEARDFAASALGRYRRYLRSEPHARLLGGDAARTLPPYTV
jgi:hypothetical protein